MMQHIHTMRYYSALKKKRNSTICNNMDGPRGYYGIKSVMERHNSSQMRHLKYIVKHRSQTVEWWLPGSRGKGYVEQLFSAYKVTDTQDESILDLCCTTLCLQLTMRQCALKNCLRVDFMINVLYKHTQKKGHKETFGDNRYVY